MKKVPYTPGNWNVEADNWLVGEYCLLFNVSKECAEYYAFVYKDKYEGKPYPNGKGFYECKNFRAVEVPSEQ
jgi:hypothetical protein